MCGKVFKWLKFNLHYFGRPPWDSGISPPELLNFIASHAPGRALDLGSGTGTNMLTLAKAGWVVEGVEYSLIGAIKTKKRLRQFGLPAKVHIQSVTNLDFLDGPYDLILDIGCFHSLDKEGKKKYCEYIEKLLSKDGFFLLYGFIFSVQSGIGIDPTDETRFERILFLIKKTIGNDQGIRPSAWFTFQKK